MPLWLEDILPLALTTVWALLALISSLHVLQNKREVGSAIGWMGLLWLAPYVGALLYWILGVNRIHRRALKLRARIKRGASLSHREGQTDETRSALSAELEPLVSSVTGSPLTRGNAIKPLINGDEAFPEMLQAIDSAEHSIDMIAYIFETDRWGDRFIGSLAAAQARGVKVRVLIDALGDLYSCPNASRQLSIEGIPVRRFMPVHRALHFNLRNHRKLLIVDRRTAFTGGMNIRSDSVLADRPQRPLHDVHFRLDGPVVLQLEEVFWEDWAFVGGEAVSDPSEPSPPSEVRGNARARAIPDGPDEDLNRIPWTLAGAIACAHKSIRIMTPYFLPDASLVTSLNVAAMRGVEVDIVIPKKSNLPLVDWAVWGQLWRFAGHGCRIWLLDGPFDHSKLMVVDGEWTLIGSSNWDPRSLRLNFELGVEIYDEDLALHMEAHVDQRRKGAALLTGEMLASRSTLRRLRDGMARLLTPYL